jgi:Mrp family chromosome partitioning ATPase
MGLDNVKQIIPVLSGKGGVGKTTIAVHLALSLNSLGYRVGILDIDLTGPSIPRMLDIESAQVLQSPSGWVPVSLTPTLSVMSIAFLLASRNDAVIWRGPKKSSMIRQFLEDVMWGDLDYLIIDTPPVSP